MKQSQRKAATLSKKSKKTTKVSSQNIKETISSSNSDESVNMAFSAGNYKIMIIGIVVLLLGFIVMSLDTEPYGQGFIGLTLGPIIVVIGFIIEFFAIFHTKK